MANKSRNASAFATFVLMATSCFVAPPAGGQTERYNSQSDLLAAISNPTIIGFDGIAPSGGYVQYVPITIDGVHFTDGVGTGYGCVLDSGFNNESVVEAAAYGLVLNTPLDSMCSASRRHPIPMALTHPLRLT